MKFTIEANHPIPPVSRPRKYELPFAQMRVGDSFFVPDEVSKPIKSLVYRQNRVEAKNQSGKRFVMRSMAGGARVWREA